MAKEMSKMILNGIEYEIVDETARKTAENNNSNNDAVFTNSASLGRKEGTTIGEKSAVFGENLEASGKGSIAVGGSVKVTADYAYGEGCNYTENGYNEQVVVSGIAGHGEGRGTKVTKEAGHAEGILTNVSAKAGHAEGEFSFAGGEASHAQNIGTMANGRASSASGLFTTASSEAQSVIGKYNVEDTNGKYAHIVGGGTDTTARNIHTVDWKGNAEYAGDVIAQGCNGADPVSLLELRDKLNQERSVVNQEYSLTSISTSNLGGGSGRYFTINEEAIDSDNATISTIITMVDREHHSTYVATVNKGDCLLLTNAHNLMSDTSYLMVFNTNEDFVERVSFDDLKNVYNKKYTFAQDSIFYICFYTEDIQSGEFFYIKKTHSNEPFVLYAEKAESYIDDAETGEATMKAIMEGRQIMIRVPNSDGGNYMALYSPVLMYQLPNYLARHLYLFYLCDGVGDTGLPSYNQLKIAVSKDYNQTPLL